MSTLSWSPRCIFLEHPPTPFNMALSRTIGPAVSAHLIFISPRCCSPMRLHWSCFIANTHNNHSHIGGIYFRSYPLLELQFINFILIFQTRDQVPNRNISEVQPRLKNRRLEEGHLLKLWMQQQSKRSNTHFACSLPTIVCLILGFLGYASTSTKSTAFCGMRPRSGRPLQRHQVSRWRWGVIGDTPINNLSVNFKSMNFILPTPYRIVHKRNAKLVVHCDHQLGHSQLYQNRI